MKLRVYDKTTGKPAKWGPIALCKYLQKFSIFGVVLAPVSFLSAIHNTYLSLFAILFLYLWIFVSQLIDSLWIFKGGPHNRLVDVFCKTDVLNEAVSK